MSHPEASLMHPESKAAQNAEERRLNTFPTRPELEKKYGPTLKELGLKVEDYEGKPTRVVEADIAATTAENAAIMAELLEEQKWYKQQN